MGPPEPGGGAFPRENAASRLISMLSGSPSPAKQARARVSKKSWVWLVTPRMRLETDWGMPMEGARWPPVLPAWDRKGEGLGTFSAKLEKTDW